MSSVSADRRTTLTYTSSVGRNSLCYLYTFTHQALFISLKCSHKRAALIGGNHPRLWEFCRASDMLAQRFRSYQNGYRDILYSSHISLFFHFMGGQNTFVSGVAPLQFEIAIETRRRARCRADEKSSQARTLRALRSRTAFSLRARAERPKQMSFRIGPGRACTVSWSVAHLAG